MDPRHDPRVRRAAREDARACREDQRASIGRERNAALLAEIEGAVCAEALIGRDDLDLYVLSIIQDYLSKGLQASPLLRWTVRDLLDGKNILPGEEREVMLDMLAGAIGLLPKSARSFAYYIVDQKDLLLSFQGDDSLWEKAKDLLNQALVRGVYASLKAAGG